MRLDHIIFFTYKLFVFSFSFVYYAWWKHVEAQSVTPFAARALDRGLTGAMVSLLRLENDSMNPNPRAQSLDSSGKAEALRARKVLSERAWKVKDKAARTLADTITADRINRVKVNKPTCKC